MSQNNSEKKAFLYSQVPPTAEQEIRFSAFLNKEFGERIAIEWKNRDEGNGFVLEYGSKRYDWSLEGRFNQLKVEFAKLKKSGDKIMPLLRETVKDFKPKAIAEESGKVISVCDGIALVSGLDNATYGEILLFPNGVLGMVQSLTTEYLGCILFGDDEEVCAGDKVMRTEKIAGVPVGYSLLGRVVNALGSPIDGKGHIDSEDFYAIERPAPQIIERQPVCEPIETGILSIDSMFPIGKGQRELIIGDRQTGKTSIALDTIINQKGKDVICVYVAIGQKSSSVAKLVDNLENHGAMDYTVVVNASASEPASYLYLAPYSGCAIGEYFMEQGKDVLIVYDDLSKHAVAYRSLSLLLDRAPGREAYPGDVFYLHSRLLERSAHLSDERGSGSMTALPIAETQSGDVSAYIPTNIISITDGQLFLESELFFAGQRPAVNVGLSVSRVGSAAQTKAMKRASGALRLELAQYREIQVFTQFAGDLDETMKRQLHFGEGLMELLKQPQGKPYLLHEQVILLIAALNKAFMNVKISEVKTFSQKLLKHFSENYDSICKSIDSNGNLSDEDYNKIVEISKEFSKM